MLLFHFLLTLTAFVLATISSPLDISDAPESAEFDKRQTIGFGQIGFPANGTNIKPGQVFPFLYATHDARYFASLGFSVYLMTSPPDNVLNRLYTQQAAGYYFGRFQYPNRQTQNPPNPPPQNLTMPDFSTFGNAQGNTFARTTFHLVVVEEWVFPGSSSAQPYAGNIISATANWIVYN